MFKLIVIAGRSRIIREGIATLLRDNDICRRIGSLESPVERQFAFKDGEPDLLIVNPEFCQKGEIKKLKTKQGNNGKPIVVGIIYQYCDRETLELFDETIYINDSEETILNKLRKLRQHTGETAKNSDLTAREKDVLRLLLQGLSNKEVAEKLVISTHTAITHRKNIIEKTGIRSLSGLAVYAILNNISDMDRIANE